MIAPFFEKLSEEYENVVFLKCDVDQCPEVAGEYDVSAMPTFVFLKVRRSLSEGCQRIVGEERKRRVVGGVNGGAFLV